ncbi:hypothetical protein D3C81_1430830 [compost metagenome]
MGIEHQHRFVPCFKPGQQLRGCARNEQSIQLQVERQDDAKSAPKCELAGMREQRLPLRRIQFNSQPAIRQLDMILEIVQEHKSRAVLLPNAPTNALGILRGDWLLTIGQQGAHRS